MRCCRSFRSPVIGFDRGRACTGRIYGSSSVARLGRVTLNSSNCCANSGDEVVQRHIKNPGGVIYQKS